MNILIDIAKGFVTPDLEDYYYVEDIIDFHTDGREFDLYFVNPHFFFILYCLNHKNCKNVKLIKEENLFRPMHIVVLGENESLLKTCKEKGLRVAHIREKVL